MITTQNPHPRGGYEDYASLSSRGPLAKADFWDTRSKSSNLSSPYVKQELDAGFPNSGSLSHYVTHYPGLVVPLTH